MLTIHRRTGESTSIGEMRLEITKIEHHRVMMVMHFPDRSIQHCALPVDGVCWTPEPDIHIYALKKAGRDLVQLGIDAPRHVPIVRDNAKKRAPIGEVVACA